MSTTTQDLRQRQWESFCLRLKSEAKEVLQNNRQRGLAIVTAHILMDASGTPQIWVVPSGKRVEPARDAGAILNSMVEGLKL